MPWICLACCFWGCFLVGFLVAGMGIMISAGRNGWRSVKAAGWPVTTGRLLSIRLDIATVHGASYKVVTKYEYMAGGVACQGERIAFGYGASGDLKLHQRILDRLQQRELLEVRYSPDDVHEAVLITGQHAGLWAGAAGGLIMVIFALAGVALYGWLR